ncbi:MAG: hypothetical protein E6J94_09425 [Methanobacteriota archaeon]|nr:MAG: hypothetical protein E6J94_09425 [Euryarchaeota archaeon]
MFDVEEPPIVVTVVAVKFETDNHMAPADRGHLISCGGAAVPATETVTVVPRYVVVKARATCTDERSDVRNHSSPAMEYVTLPDVTLTQSFVS